MRRLPRPLAAAALACLCAFLSVLHVAAADYVGAVAEHCSAPCRYVHNGHT